MKVYVKFLLNMFLKRKLILFLHKYEYRNKTKKFFSHDKLKLNQEIKTEKSNCYVSSEVLRFKKTVTMHVTVTICVTLTFQMNCYESCDCYDSCEHLGIM